ncbi:MAG: 1-(5-phosphoribosyl)-5-[(5-phosphoribosylamino)methylideneamino]imidazole-4-carboxamide isomerase [Candidatus Omnitrophota bacterium]
MIIFPAIDIKNGKVVRLIQGKFDQVTEYAQDPANVAMRWDGQGAQWLHVVDLDGAQKGTVTNWSSIQAITKTVSIPVQFGGGVRNELDVERLFKMGIKRVILGTQAINNQELLRRMVLKWREAIAVSIDASNGLVTKLGWTEQTEVRAVDLAKKLEDLGLKYLIFTDIARDGMLTGPNFGSLDEILDAVDIPVIASGGVSTINDLKKLKTFEPKGLMGAIIGKALYENKLDLKEALSI